MITVHVFSDRLHRYAFSNDKSGDNLPVLEDKAIWNFIETRTYQLNNKKFPLLQVTSNQINKEIVARGYFIIDVLEQNN